MQLAMENGMTAVSVRSDAGSLFTRTAAALGMHTTLTDAARYAAERWQDMPSVGMFLSRAAQSPTFTTGDGTALIAPGAVEFLNLVRPRTVLGRLQRLRRVPFHQGAAMSSGGSVFMWVGEGAPTPVGHLGFTAASMQRLKVGGIVVASDELLRTTSLSAEAVFRDEMVNGLAAFSDESFLSADAAVADVSPAGILVGATSTATTGDPEDDLAELLSSFESLDGVTVIASEKTAIALAGQGAYANGKLNETLPVILSSAADDNLIAIHAPSVLFADEGEVEVERSTAATLQMDSDPADPTVEGTVMVSLWQRNLTALLVKRYMNWEAQADSVSVITGVAY